MLTRSDLQSSRCWVIKIGSALLTADGRGLDRQAISSWVAQIVAIRRKGIQVLLVSSGAVAEGMQRLGWSARPQALHHQQAAAAVGQMGLIQTYESSFQQFGYHTAQILLTHDDLACRTRYLNAKNTLQTLLTLNVIPIINENDTVATDEIRFGDNDTLGGLVANLVVSDLLVILTDQDGMFDADPRQNKCANLIHEMANDDPMLDQAAGDSGGALGRGGMATKLRAARLAARSGTATLIANGHEPEVLRRIFVGDDVGTFLSVSKRPLSARKQWLAGQLRVSGRLMLDRGASDALCHSGKSLLPVGVESVEGRFHRGDLVACIDVSGHEIARGLVNYSADEMNKIKRMPSQEIARVLGYVDTAEVIHRDNLVLLSLA